MNNVNKTKDKNSYLFVKENFCHLVHKFDFILFLVPSLTNNQLSTELTELTELAELTELHRTHRTSRNHVCSRFPFPFPSLPCALPTAPPACSASRSTARCPDRSSAGDVRGSAHPGHVRCSRTVARERRAHH
jgi:hypothetical protein